MVLENVDFERLTSQEVNEIIGLAGQIYQYAQVFTPYTSHQNLIAKNNNPSVPTFDKVDKLLKDASQNEDVLRAFSEFADSYSPLYSRTIDYYANMLSFDLHITCKNASATDYKSEAYQKDLERVYKFLDKFNYKQHFTAALKQIIRTGVYFGWFRTSTSATNNMGEVEEEKIVNKSTYALQQMPTQYCLITGQDENTYLYDFDMNYFLNPGVSIESYDPIFKKYFNEIFTEKNYMNTYNPNAPLVNRNGVYAQWHQTSPVAGAVCLVWDYSNAKAISPFSPLIKNILTDAEMEGLQSDVNMMAAKGILYGDIQLLTKQKSGETQNAFSLLPKTLSKYLALVKAGLDKNIAVGAMPTTNTKYAQFDNSETKSLYSDQLTTTAGNGASASRLIYSSDKASQFELQCQIESDYNRVAKLYEQFNNLLNLYVNKKTKKFKFNFFFSGSNYRFMREKESKNLLDLANVGFVLGESAYAKIVDMQPNEFHRALVEGHNSGMLDNLSQLISIHNTSSNEVGRPKAELTEQADSTEINNGG